MLQVRSPGKGRRGYGAHDKRDGPSSATGAAAAPSTPLPSTLDAYDPRTNYLFTPPNRNRTRSHSPADPATSTPSSASASPSPAARSRSTSNSNSTSPAAAPQAAAPSALQLSSPPLRREEARGLRLVHGQWSDPFVVIEKPPGLPVQAFSEDCVEARLRAMGKTHVFFPHRLDKVRPRHTRSCSLTLCFATARACRL